MPTCASACGELPYTYCHAHTCRPWALRAATCAGENWAHWLPPSPDLRNTVLTPWAAAWRPMATGSPPWEALRYQIHIPLPSSTLAPAVTGGWTGGDTMCAGGRRTVIRIPFDRELPGDTSRSTPLTASAGTVTSIRVERTIRPLTLRVQ